MEELPTNGKWHPLETLKELVLSLIKANDRRYEERFKAAENSVNIALSAAEKAVAKAEFATEKRFEGVNEFRGALTDATSKNVLRTEFDLVVSRLEQDIKNLQLARGELMPRVETLGLFKAIDDRFKEMSHELATLREARSEGTGRGRGLNDGWKYLIGAVTLVGAILGIVIYFAK